MPIRNSQQHHTPVTARSLASPLARFMIKMRQFWPRPTSTIFFQKPLFAGRCLQGIPHQVNLAITLIVFVSFVAFIRFVIHD